MSKHIDQLKHCSIPLAYQLLSRYDYARSAHGDVTVKQAKQYAVAQTEAKRQNGNKPSINIFSKRYHTHGWYTGKATWARADLFDRLIEDALGAVPRIRGKDTLEDAIAHTLRRHRPDVWQQWEISIENHARIFGEHFDDVLVHWFPNVQYQRAWYKIRRGRDLFIKGLGSFNIAAAIGASDGRALGTILPIEITAHGYGFHSTYTLERLLRDKSALAYFIRYKDYWLTHMTVVDELRRAVEYDIPLTIPPQELLRRFREQRQEHRARILGAAITPSKYTHGLDLATLPDFPTEYGTLVPIRDHEQLAEVGGKMQNCAVSYSNHVAERSVLLLALLDEEANPIGLGEVRYNRSLGRWEWGQRLGPHNRQLPEAVREVFQTYPVIASGIYQTPKPHLIGEPQ